MLLPRAQSGVFLQPIFWNHFKILLLEHLCLLSGFNVQHDSRGVLERVIVYLLSFSKLMLQMSLFVNIVTPSIREETCRGGSTKEPDWGKVILWGVVDVMCFNYLLCLVVVALKNVFKVAV